MRYSPGQKETTRTRLLRATAESIGTRGVAATTIGGVSAAAGITHGGFYAHFRSRDELVAAGIREMFSPRDTAVPSATSDARQKHSRRAIRRRFGLDHPPAEAELSSS